MEEVTIYKDIKVLSVTADSFPAGIEEAHKKLHKVVESSPQRKYFGLSRPENGVIVYRAAAEEISEEEGEQLKCDTMVLKKGKYVSVLVTDFIKDIPSIDRAFKELLSYPNLDPDGYCVEWYINEKDVKCMIRLNE